MSLRDDILPILDSARALMDDLGFRQFDVLMRVVSWSGSRPGLGSKSTVDTALHVAGSKRIKVTRISSRDIIASGGFYHEGDYRIGPMTPAFPGGGILPTDINPAIDDPKEIFFRLTGPGFENGSWFRKVDQEVWKNLSYTFVIRAANVTNP